jgi:hypothetical protein
MLWSHPEPILTKLFHRQIFPDKMSTNGKAKANGNVEPDQNSSWSKAKLARLE